MSDVKHTEGYLQRVDVLVHDTDGYDMVRSKLTEIGVEWEGSNEKLRSWSKQD